MNTPVSSASASSMLLPFWLLRLICNLLNFLKPSNTLTKTAFSARAAELQHQHQQVSRIFWLVTAFFLMGVGVGVLLQL